MENGIPESAAGEKSGVNGAKPPHICGYRLEKPALRSMELERVLRLIPRQYRKKLVSGYDVKSFAKIFEDEDMMRTVDAFLECGMNVSETSRKLYMHRNTLMYRLNTVRRQTGLDLKNFNMALTFKILHTLYSMK